MLGVCCCWCSFWSRLRTGSGPLSCLTLLNTPNILLNTPIFSSNRLPSTVPVEKIPHDLCPVPQLDTTGEDLYFKDPCPVWKGRTPKRQWVVTGVGRWNHILRGCEVEWTHLMYSRWGSGSPQSCWGYQSSPGACPFQVMILRLMNLSGGDGCRLLIDPDEIGYSRTWWVPCVTSGWCGCCFC